MAGRVARDTWRVRRRHRGRDGLQFHAAERQDAEHQPVRAWHPRRRRGHIDPADRRQQGRRHEPHEPDESRRCEANERGWRCEENHRRQHHKGREHPLRRLRACARPYGSNAQDGEWSFDSAWVHVGIEDAYFQNTWNEDGTEAAMSPQRSPNLHTIFTVSVYNLRRICSKAERKPSTSRGVWTAETKLHSNCDGAM